MKVDYLLKNKLIELRRKGFSYRDISRTTGLSLGLVFKYSKHIELSDRQKGILKKRGAVTLNSRLSKEDKIANGRKGGFSTPHKIKFSKNVILSEIKNFNLEKNRIPLKKEASYYRAARRVFGTWNKAILEAGFEPNPAKFSKKFIANDGHKVDSLSEKIVDDWLSARKINHTINLPYPGKYFLTVDFFVRGYWIEFFGLCGVNEKYDESKRLKKKISKEFPSKLIELYPEDIFLDFKLDKKLGFLI